MWYISVGGFLLAVFVGFYMWNYYDKKETQQNEQWDKKEKEYKDRLKEYYNETCQLRDELEMTKLELKKLKPKKDNKLNKK